MNLLCAWFGWFCAATVPAPVVTPPVSSNPPVTSGSIAGIITIAANSSCISHRWSGRGLAPRGYIKGLALMYAREVCRKKDAISSAMTQPLGSGSTDALAWYSLNPNMNNLFTLGTGLGMRESSGCYTTGYDTSAGSETSMEAEAGLFQMSANAVGSSSVAKSTLTTFSSDSSKCFVNIFAEGSSCANQEIIGSGPGADYQKLVKSCPGAAVESSFLIMRVLRKHWGPLNRQEAEFFQGCSNMYSQVDSFISSNPEVCLSLL